MKPFWQRNLFSLSLYAFFTLLVIVTSGFPFFFDTIQLASKHAQFFYQTHFSSFILPNEMDSGHIPTLGMYLALIWQWFGKTLTVSHLAMLPWVLGIVYQTLKLSRFLFQDKRAWWLSALILADATLMAQCTLVSPDIWIVFFFLMGVNQLLAKNRGWLTIALLGLALTSMRGMMCVAAFFAVDGYLFWFEDKKRVGLKTLCSSQTYPYMPAALISALFFGWHFYKTGWFGYHANMPWSELFEPVNLQGAVRNVFILGWRMADFGRLFVLLSLLFCVIHWVRNKPAIDKYLRMFGVLFFVLLLALGQAVVLHKNLSCHRYLLPLYVSVALFTGYYLLNFVQSRKFRYLILSITLAGMLSGHFWVYPDRISKGWDASLAYLPYFPLREKIMKDMQKENIPLSETGSDFPNLGPLNDLELSGNPQAFVPYNLNTNKYIFYSNIYNSFSDEELFELKNKWVKVLEYNGIQVRITLYKRPNSRLQGSGL